MTRGWSTRGSQLPFSVGLKDLALAFQEQGFIDQLLKVLEVMDYELHPQPITQTFFEAVDLLFLFCDIIRCISSQLIEPSEVLHD